MEPRRRAATASAARFLASLSSPQCLGEDPSREGLLKTPQRMAKSLLSMTSGSAQTAADVVSDALFSCASREMVLVRDLSVESLCEHHLLPFTGRAHIAYIPNGRVIGLSKLSRLVECFSKRLQLQERLTLEIAEALGAAVDARGVAVMIECECVGERWMLRGRGRARRCPVFGRGGRSEVGPPLPTVLDRSIARDRCRASLPVARRLGSLLLSLAPLQALVHDYARRARARRGDDHDRFPRRLSRGGHAQSRVLFGALAR